MAESAGQDMAATAAVMAQAQAEAPAAKGPFTYTVPDADLQQPYVPPEPGGDQGGVT